MNLTIEAYEAPVYRNILDILASVEHMNAQVFDGTIRLALGMAASRGFAGYAINKTAIQSQLAGAYLITTELLGMPPAQARAMIATMGDAQGPGRRTYNAMLARLQATLDPVRRQAIVSDLQDELETLVRELNRVRLPLPTDLRNWARRMEDLAYTLIPTPYQPPQLSDMYRREPPPPTGMEAYEICVQAKQMIGWIPQMQLALDKEIAKANLKGKLGTTNLELTPSLRAIDAATSRATVSVLERQTSARIDAARTSRSGPPGTQKPAPSQNNLTTAGARTPSARSPSAPWLWPTAAGLLMLLFRGL